MKLCIEDSINRGDNEAADLLQIHFDVKEQRKANPRPSPEMVRMQMEDRNARFVQWLVGMILCFGVLGGGISSCSN